MLCLRDAAPDLGERPGRKGISLLTSGARAGRLRWAAAFT
jgi:hypothetical protein